MANKQLGQVIEGGFGRNPANNRDNYEVIEELEKWLERARERRIISIAICAIAEDGNVLTQYVPEKGPSDVFKLVGGVQHLLTRVQDNIER